MPFSVGTTNLIELLERSSLGHSCFIIRDYCTMPFKGNFPFNRLIQLEGRGANVPKESTCVFAH